MIDEPTAAAVAYVLSNKQKYDDLVRNSMLEDDNGKFYIINMLVADFGGGTSDFSKLVLSGNVNKDNEEVYWRFEGNAISLIQYFGGQDITRIIQIDLILQILQAMNDLERAALDEEDRTIMKQQIYKLAETAKKRLSLNQTWEYQYRWEHKNYSLCMSQAHLKYLNTEHIQLIKKRVKKCIQEDQINQLLMVGGSAEVPFIKETLRDLVGPNCNIETVRQGRDMIAHGAAYIGQIVANKYLNIQFHQITAFDLGIGLSKGKMLHLIRKGDPIPITKTDTKIYVNDKAANCVNLRIYEGNSEYTKNNICIGKTLIDFGAHYKKHEYKVKITAALNNNVLFENYITSLGSNDS